MQNGTATSEISKIVLPYNPTLLLSIFSKEPKSNYNGVTCLPVFFAGLFIIVKL
jgi:hypothetical protein